MEAAFVRSFEIDAEKKPANADREHAVKILTPIVTTWEKIRKDDDHQRLGRWTSGELPSVEPSPSIVFFQCSGKQTQTS